MKNASTFNVVLVCGPIICELATSENQTLLLGIDTCLLLDAFLDAPDGVCGVDVDLGLVAGEKLDFDKHF